MRTILALSLLALIALTGCENNNSNNNSNSSSATSNTNSSAQAAYQPHPPIVPTTTAPAGFKSCNVYMPLVPGSEAKYTITYSSGLVTDGTVVVDSGEENGQKIFVERTQIRDRTGGLQKMETEEKRYVCDGERVRLLSQKTRNDIEAIQHRSDWKMRGDSVAMIDPESLERKGSTWSYSFILTLQKGEEQPVSPEEPFYVFFETMGPQEITVPAGTFKTIMVKRKVGKNEIFDYYARGIGLVKRQASEGTSWVLKEYGGLRPVD
jgi:hypothetical protein